MSKPRDRAHRAAFALTLAPARASADAISDQMTAEARKLIDVYNVLALRQGYTDRIRRRSVA